MRVSACTAPRTSFCSEDSFANELILLHNVSHPNIMHFYDAQVVRTAA